MKKIRVALTGGIGSGKSTTAKIFESLGAYVVSGDELGKQVLSEDHDVRNQLIARLGNDIMIEGHTIDRGKVAFLVFRSPQLSKWLTDLTFPGIHRRWQELAESACSSVVMFDAALIFEWHIENEFDLIVTVRSSVANTVARSAGRFADSDLQNRLNSQITVDDKASRSHVTIDNNDSLDQLKDRVNEIWNTKILPLTA